MTPKKCSNLFVIQLKNEPIKFNLIKLNKIPTMDKHICLSYTLKMGNKLQNDGEHRTLLKLFLFFLPFPDVWSPLGPVCFVLVGPWLRVKSLSSSVS